MTSKNIKKISNDALKNAKSAMKKQQQKKEADKKNEVAKIEVPKTRHIAPPQYCMCKVGTEIYITDEENYKPYVSSFNQAVVGATASDDEEKKEGDEEEEEEEEAQEEEEEDDEDNPGYTLHMGEIIGTHYVNQISSMGFESDYKEMTFAGSLKLDNVDLTKSYKGVRLQLLSEWEKPQTNIKWEDLTQGVLGFITEQRFSDNNVEIKVSGMTKTMEQKVKFEFKQMKRSEILREIILTAGLKPMINVEGLDDDVTDFSNLSSSGSSDSGSGDTPGIGNAEIDDLVKKWCKGKSNDLDKAQAVHAGLRDDVGIWYAYYYNSKYHTPENCLKHHKDPGLNCGDTAILTTACMKSAGLNAYIVLRCDSAHYFTVIEISGTKYYSDLTWSEGARSQRAWNDTWEHNKCGNKYNLS